MEEDEITQGEMVEKKTNVEMRAMKDVKPRGKN